LLSQQVACWNARVKKKGVRAIINSISKKILKSVCMIHRVVRSRMGKPYRVKLGPTYLAEECMKTFCNLLFVVFVLAVGTLSGCGSNRQLQSLSISPASTNSQAGRAQFTATGQFSSMPTSVSPASVSWWQSPPIIDPPSAMFGLGLTSQSFTAQCSGFSGPITITALAPADAGNLNPSISSMTFTHLVLQHSAIQESGFVAATATMNCP
jgi:hypothetical protein